MMDKVLVNVYVPIISKAYDMFIPKASYLSETLELIKKAVVELSDGKFVSDKNVVLCYRNSGQILDINKSIVELEILSGSKLMLI